ncbi:ChbG/HpnK family deacetylase [Clostridium sp. C2-6-12]|uniref:ChbG/HpnK family deacetylase n=1 Tax=Clostridium sp. C2-6-12 TaxID=2698832 RepID=UPI00136CD38F|nr:ChbG/HpnK family deacetylase [Clostridium sp. C2-6-12]
MKKFLIRADDLGYSEGVNYGIAKSAIEGLVGSIGVMPNMDSVKHGLKLLEGHNFCLGQHTNICIGRPITDPERIPSLVNENGEFKSSSEFRTAKEDFVDLNEVIIEIEAQYNRFVELTGQQPHYFEGHAVMSKNFFKGLEIVAQKHSLKYSGISFDGTPIRIGSTDVHICQTNGINPDYDAVKAIYEAVETAEDDGTYLYVCHPGYLDEYILTHSSMTRPRTKEVEMLCDTKVKEMLEKSGVKCITYDDL